MSASHDLIFLVPAALGDTDLPLPGKQSGKVRDWYPLADQKRLIVTTDRLSAFDIVLGRVPYKGQILNQLTNWWMHRTDDLLANHLVAEPDPNAAIVQEAEPFLVEVIVRGYITGVTSTALWYRYSLGERNIYGYTFPKGLRKNQALPEPIITPTTKGGVTGHDERLTCAEVVEKGLLDEKTWGQVQTAALDIFRRGQEIAARAGLILVDTKYEFGRLPDGRMAIIDEIHTPDSSRFWKMDSYPSCFTSGQEPENFDKEFVRMEYAARGFRGDGEPPVMPNSLWAAAGERYIQIYEMLTGQIFIPGAYPAGPRLEANLRKEGLLR